MLKKFKLLAFLIFFFMMIQEISAQYVNVDSLIHLPGSESPVLLSEFQELMEELQVEDLQDGQEFYLGQDIPAGTLLRHFAVPSDGKVISRYGWRSGRMHTGTDLKHAKGDTIYAAFQGTVTRAKHFYGYGYMVVLDHGNQLETSYAHLSAFLVRAGDEVRKGQPIGLAGSTGRASTNHLHFEIRESGQHYNPELVFDFEKGVVKEQAHEIQSLAELLSSAKQPLYASGDNVSRSYIVAEGDSLWKISRRFKTSVKTLCHLNNLSENTVLSVGMVLKLF